MMRTLKMDLPRTEDVRMNRGKAEELIGPKGLAERKKKDYRHGEGQRRIDQAHVEELGRELITDWLPISLYPEASTTIIRASDGVVIQSQHRLLAWLSCPAGFSLPWKIRYVSDEDATRIIRVQALAKEWSDGQVLDALCKFTDPTRVMSVLRVCKLIDSKARGMGYGKSSGAMELAEKFGEATKWACTILVKNETTAAVTGAFAWMHWKGLTDEEYILLEMLAKRVSTGLDIVEGDPAGTIRKMLAKKSGGEAWKRDCAWSTLFLIEAALTRRSCTRKPSVTDEAEKRFMARWGK